MAQRGHVGSDGSRAVLADVQRAATRRGLSLGEDARLARLAAWFAEATQRIGGSPPLDAIDFATRHVGMMEPLPALLVTVQAEDGEWQPPLESLFEHAPRNISYNRAGVAVLDVGGNRIAGVALAASHVDTSYIPRSVSQGTALWFDGRLEKGYSHPELAVTMPDGSTRRTPLGTRDSFSTRLSFEAVGQNQLELLATGPSGLEVIANFPLYVGSAPPSRIALREEPPEDIAQASRTLLDLVNEERRRSGLRPLQFDARLSRVAHAHSDDMAAQRFFGHESPTRGDPVRRARGAGLAIKQLGENVGRGPSARDLHRLLMGSPGHRSNILKPEFTHIGVGVVADESAGERVLLATQFFASLSRALPQRQFNAELLDLVNQSRSARSTPPLEQDAELERVACSGAGEQEQTRGTATATANRARGSGDELKAVVGVAYEPADIATDPALYAPGARRVGVCVTPLEVEPGTVTAARNVVIVVSAGSYPAAEADATRKPAKSRAVSSKKSKISRIVKDVVGGEASDEVTAP